MCPKPNETDVRVTDYKARLSRETAIRTDPATGSVSETVSQMELEIGDLLAQLRGVMKELKDVVKPVPMVLSYERAAQELSISVPTLKRMVRRGEITPVPVAKRMGIPRPEIERIARGEPRLPASSKPRSARAKKQEAKSHGDSIRALAKKF